MKKKAAFTVCVCLMAMLLLCSCGRPTALGILKDMASAYGKTSSFEGTADMELVLDVGTSALGTGVNLELTSDTETDIQGAGNVYHIQGTTTVGVGSFGSSGVEIDCYTVTDDTQTTVYTKTGDKWTKHSAGAQETAAEASGSGGIADIFKALAAADMSLRDETEMYNGREVYVIDLTLGGDAVKLLARAGLESAVSGLFGENTQLDMSDVNAAVVLKVYKDTKLPAELEMDLGNSLQGALDAAAEKLSGSISAVIDLDVSMEIKAHTITICFGDYNTIDSIDLPEEVYSAEESSGISGGGLLDSVFS